MRTFLTILCCRRTFIRIVKPQLLSKPPPVNLQSILKAKAHARGESEPRVLPSRKFVEPTYDKWEEDLLIEEDYDWSTADRDRIRRPSMLPHTSRRPATSHDAARFSQTKPVYKHLRANTDTVVPSGPHLLQSAHHTQQSTSGSIRLKGNRNLNDIPSTTLPTSKSTSLLSLSSPTGNQKTLKSKKSTPHLHLTRSSSISNTPTLNRKRSLPALTEVNLATPRAIDSSSGLPQGNRIPSASHTSTKSYTFSTLASRARQNALPPLPISSVSRISTSRLPSETSSVAPSFPSTSSDQSHFRASKPSYRPLALASDPSGNSSTALGTSSPDAESGPPRLLRRPKRPREYGDGTELDRFENLPTNPDLERKFTTRVVLPRVDRSSIAAKGVTSSLDKPMTRILNPRNTIKERRRNPELKIKPQLIRSLGANATSRGTLTLYCAMLRVLDILQSKVVWSGIRSP